MTEIKVVTGMATCPSCGFEFNLGEKGAYLNIGFQDEKIFVDYECSRCLVEFTDWYTYQNTTVEDTYISDEDAK